MAQVIAKLANMYCRDGVFLSVLEQSRVTLLLKKPGVDQSDMSNFRPITTPPTLSKILERLALCRLGHHVMTTGNLSEYQSAYRAGHSTQTALLKVINDIITTMCHQEPTVVLSFDISATSDTIDHSILIDHNTSDFGITGSALRWLQSFFSGRSQYVGVGDVWPVSVSCLSGVPQGPLLFSTYISLVANVVKGHNLHQHQYADDTQLCMTVIPNDGGLLHVISSCRRCLSMVPGEWLD